MTLPREPIDWASTEDEPVSLEAAVEASEVLAGPAPHRLDPTVAPSPPPRGGDEFEATGLSMSRRSAVALLTMCCGLTFAHGWSTGAKASRSESCGASHCQPHQSSNEWKEEQYP